jgi:WD40 repeat protein
MLNGHSLTVTGLIFNRNDAILLSGSHDGTIMLWDVSKPKTDLEFGAIDFPEGESATGMTFKPNSNLLTTNNSDGKLTIWDVSSLANPKKTKTLDGPINITVFSRDGNLMASSGDDNVVTLWDATDFVELSTIKIDDKRVNAIELSTDGKTLAIIGEKIILWDITDPQKPAQFTILPQQINEMADMVFNSDGKIMASITDKNIVLWDVSNPASPARVGVVLEGHTNTVNNLAFSPTNANLLASASSDRTVILWNITDPGNPQKINTLGNHSDWVNTVSFSPDGTMLATGSDDKQVNLWNITNPEEPALISTMIGHSERVNTVRFGPQGGFIASLGDDNKIIFWDINPESWAQKACSIAGGDFTVIEWDQFFPSEDYRQTCKSFPSTLEVVVATLEPVPTVEQSDAPLPVCTNAQTPSCSLPSSKQLDEFCVDNNSYGLYNLPLYTTFEVLTPGFTCIDEKVNSLGEPRISCTGPTDEEFEVSFCNSSCSNTLEPSNQCEAGFGLNSAQGCCAPISDTSDGCVVEVLTLNGCE